MSDEKLHVKAAAWIRNDGITTIGKSHADILKKCPFGTCKAGSVSGFIDNNDQFIDRERAYQIALAAGQIKPEKLHNDKILFSEAIWSDHDNGDWTYDDELGYVRR